MNKNYEKALEWVKKYSFKDGGIAITSQQNKIYPEVSGYYIPTLLKIGENVMAKQYAIKLCSIQKDNGSWYDPEDSAPYIFDSAQILKGLISIRKIMPEVDPYIIKGCDWILSNMNDEGRLISPDENAWGRDDAFCSELIHVYCLSPLKEAGEIWGKKVYAEAAEKALTYYIKKYEDKIMEFSLLSHFYAYVMEGLIDMGRGDITCQAMNNIKKYQTSDNFIPALNNVKWVCSTGMLQLALVWYKLENLEEGNKLYEAALSLQNEDGGWYGSYPLRRFHKYLPLKKYKPGYFKDQEISWAVKYYFDATYKRTELNI